MARHVGYVAEVAEAPEFVNMPDSLRVILSQDEDGLVALNALDQHEGRLAALARQAVNEIAEHERDELRQLEDGVRSLLAGKTPGGYFGKRFLCGLAKASMAAGLITVWVPPYAHAVAAVALGGKVYKTNKCSKD